MYRMFTGRFAQGGIPKAGEGARKLPPPKQISPKLPDKLSEVIMSCLELSPERRPNGMFEVQQELVGIARGLGLEPQDLRGTDDEEP
jgi:serine/threonine-protein kinase